MMEIAKHKIPTTNKDYLKQLKVYLRIFVKEIEACNYSCEAGSLENNKTWVGLKSVVKNFKEK
jgi:hypothetical protein